MIINHYNYIIKKKGFNNNNGWLLVKQVGVRKSGFTLGFLHLLKELVGKKIRLKVKIEVQK